jgi:hypothetical protein
MSTPTPCACLRPGCPRCDHDGRITHWDRGYRRGMRAAAEEQLRILDRWSNDPAFAVELLRRDAECAIRYAAGGADARDPVADGA